MGCSKKSAAIVPSPLENLYGGTRILVAAITHLQSFSIKQIASVSSHSRRDEQFAVAPDAEIPVPKLRTL
jgi:hypothetical protein